MSTPTERFMDLWLLDREDLEYWSKQAKQYLEYVDDDEKLAIEELSLRMLEEVEHDIKSANLKTTYLTFLWYYLDEVDFVAIATAVVENV